MQWLETSDIRTKLAGVFLYMNNGQPIGVSNIAVLFKLLHPERSEVDVPLANETYELLILF